MGSLLITIVYTGLLAWGFFVGARQIYQGYRQPEGLLNPLFSNRWAIHMFSVHIFIASAMLFVIGPLAIANKSTLWFWGGVIALLTTSIPIGAYFNRNPQTFGKLIGRWVVVRNFFEYSVFTVVAAVAVNWSNYYLLLWWLIAYRYLDVGPRRFLQKLYDTPEKKAARPWAPILNWVVIVTIYVLAYLVVDNELIRYAEVPADSVATHIPADWEVGVVVGFNFALLLATWTLTKRYTQSLIPAPTPAPRVAAGSPSPTK